MQLKSQMPPSIKVLDGICVGDKVRVDDGRTVNEGTVVIINPHLSTPYGVCYPWDVTNNPWYYEKKELERVS